MVMKVTNIYKHEIVDTRVYFVDTTIATMIRLYFNVPSLITKVIIWRFAHC